MKNLVLCFCFCIPAFSYAQDVLTNADIVKLTKLELPSAAIISKIRNSHSRFNVSVDSLVALKTQGVNGEVVSEMITADAREQKEAASRKNYRDPRTMRKEGIYYYASSDTANPFIVLDASVNSYKTQSVGSSLAKVYTYGLAKSKIRSEISGAHARRQISQVKPCFYFYLDASKATSPNEFALVQLTENEDSREMVMGKSNVYTAAFSIDKSQMVEFQYEQIADGIYKVYPKHPLDVGEYCFVYTSSAPTTFSNSKAYDFRISAK